MAALLNDGSGNFTDGTAWVFGSLPGILFWCTHSRPAHQRFDAGPHHIGIGSFCGPRVLLQRANATASSSTTSSSSLPSHPAVRHLLAAALGGGLGGGLSFLLLLCACCCVLAILCCCCALCLIVLLAIVAVALVASCRRRHRPLCRGRCRRRLLPRPRQEGEEGGRRDGRDGCLLPSSPMPNARASTA
jgi:hypothetical protein